MMKKLGQSLKNRSSNTATNGVLSYDDAVRALDIEASARSDAAQGIPGAQGGVTETELRIKRALTAEASRLHEKVHSVHDHHRRSLNLHGELDQAQAQYRAKIENLGNRLDSQTEEHISRIGESRSRFLQAETALRSFRSTHRLDRTAHEEKTLIFNLGVLLAIILVEAAFNSTMFAQGSDQGLLGGVIVAAIASFMNVGQGVIHGLFVRLVSHVRLWRRLLGLLALATFAGLTLVVNNAIANYRALSVEASGNALLDGRLVNLFTDIHWWGDFHSAVLFILGIAFALGGLYKGYTWTDPYWGYGSIAYERDTLAELLEEDKTEAQTELNELSEQARQAGGQFQEQVEVAVKHYRSAIVECDAARRQYGQDLEDLQDLGCTLFELYRSLNLRSRPEGEAMPEWPERTWSVDPALREIPPLQPLNERAITGLRREALARGDALHQQWIERWERNRERLVQAGRGSLTGVVQGPAAVPPQPRTELKEAGGHGPA